MRKILLGLGVIYALALLWGCEKNNDGDIWGIKGQITINGITYKVSAIVGSYGCWNEDTKKGWFTVTVEEEHNEGIYPIDYDFEFRSRKQLSVGDNFANLTLRMSHPERWYDYLRYCEGDAKVISFDKRGSEMTIRFSNLKMSDGSTTYVINGRATVPYDLYPEL